MDKVVDIFTKDFEGQKDNDIIDRLSSTYTVLILVAAAFGLSAYQYTGDPVHCWAPKHFEGGWEKYANAYCWVNNTYYLPFDDDIPKEHETDRQYVVYYQWITFILLGQALLFYLPSVVWNGLNQQAGVDADNILAYAQSLDQASNFENRLPRLKMICNQMDRFLGGKHSLSKTEFKHQMASGCSTKRFGCYLVILYLITKVLYLANVIAQLFILNAVLAVEFSVYGIEVLRWMMDDYDWTTSPQVAFPRVTMCDFKVRRLGNVHRYTVQCTLPINLYTEKIYMFLWFWMVFVATCTAISFATWVCRVLSPTDRITYVSNHLKMLKKEFKSEAEKDKLKRFVKSYLRQDGAFLLRLIGHNTNTITVTEIIGSLWTLWSKRDDEKHDKKPDMMELKPTTAFE